MSESGCATCSFRARYDENSRSILGRLWRWHTKFCPGWKSYLRSLPEDEKAALIARYDLTPERYAG